MDDDLIEAACEVMHVAYEAAAARQGWATQLVSRVPWDRVPPENRATMRAAVSTLLGWLADAANHTGPMSENEAPTFLKGFGPATTCVIGLHRPKPLRYVWHHVLPRTAGGTDDPANLIQLCDNCHLSVEALLFQLVQNGGHEGALGRGNRKQQHYAMDGYRAALNAGTLNKIPNEGGALPPTG